MPLHTKIITRELVVCRDEPRRDSDLCEPGPPLPQRARSRFTTAAPATVLVLTANASLRYDPLQLDQEMRDIDEALRRAQCRERYTLHTRPAATFRAAIAAIDDLCPDFVHVACHADRQGRLMLTREDGQTHLVEPDHFAELLGLQATRPRLVTFAACDSVRLAKAAALHADLAIGFAGPVLDDTALLFSATLYERLASRAQPDIGRAFGLARLACRGLGCADADLARLFERPGVGVDGV